MAQIIYGQFADQVFKQSIETTNWADIPPKLRVWALLWRDGDDIRNHLSVAQYYKVRRALLDDYGLDIGVPCNIQALTRRVQTVTVTPINALRVAA